VRIEDSKITVEIDNKQVIFFNGITPLKLSPEPFHLDTGGKPLTIMHLSLFRRKLRPRVISGDDFFREKMYAKAAELYLKVARDHPDLKVSREALFKAGLCLEYDKDYEKAVSVFRKFTKKDGSLYLRALCHIWLCYIHMNNLDAANALYTTIQRDFSLYDMFSQVPFDSLHAIFTYYVEQAERQDDMEKSIGLLERAIDTAEFLGLDEEAFDTRNKIGEIYQQKKDFHRAIAEFRRAQAAYPHLQSKCAWNQMKIAEMCRLMKEIPACIKEYQKVILRYPDQDIQKSWAMLWLAEIAVTEEGKKPEEIAAAYTSSRIAEGLPSLAAEALFAGRDVPAPEKIDSFFRNDILYFTAVNRLAHGKTRAARDLLRKALLLSRENDWPEELIKRRLDKLDKMEKTGAEQPVF